MFFYLAALSSASNVKVRRRYDLARHRPNAISWFPNIEHAKGNAYGGQFQIAFNKICIPVTIGKCCGRSDIMTSGFFQRDWRIYFWTPQDSEPL
jgi:hypothetical protein